MKKINKITGSLIPLGWPQTPVREVGMWYDKVTWLFKEKGNYYRAGHAALLLVNHETKECFYFDFGRYHTTHQKGRVRDKFTDVDLAFDIPIQFKDDSFEIANLHQIGSLLSSFEETHGDGDLLLSQYFVDFDVCYHYAKSLQEKGEVNYGPFDLTGTNCSRFVNKTLLQGVVTSTVNRFFLAIPLFLTPTTIRHIRFCPVKGSFTIIKNNHIPLISSTPTVGTILEPSREKYNVPISAKWLSGTGAGAWFDVKSIGENKFKILRYDNKGTIDSEYIAQSKSGDLIDLERGFKVGYPSHNLQCVIVQGEVMNVIFNTVKH